MAVRKPLVLVNGQRQQLQAGDSIAGAVATVSTCEVDFGSTPTSEKEFSVTDAGITTTSNIVVTQSGLAATGKQEDENAMDALVAVAIPASGSFTLLVRTVDPTARVIGRFKFHYIAG